MPDSASGESMTRSSPKSFCRPSVIRKTPPSLPTSSPITRTFGSSSMALRSPALRPFASVIFAISVSAFRLEGVEVRRIAGLLLGELGGLLGVHVVEHVERPRLRERLAALTQVLAQPLGLDLDLVEEVLVGQPVAGEVGLHPLDRVLELPDLEVLRQPVAGGVVGGGVRAH